MIFSKNTFSEHGMLFLAGLISALAYAYLAFHSQYYAQAGLFELFISCGIAATASLIAWCYYHYSNRSISIPILLLWALTFRLIGVYGFPVLEDDFYRYLWDGYQFVIYDSPYSQAPIVFFDDAKLTERFEEILSKINHPDFITVYGPVCQWLFALSYLISPGEVWPLQILFGFFDFLLVCLLLKLAPAKYVLLYAWNPLLIKEFSFTAHPDVMAVFFLFAAILLLKKYCYYSAILIALAVGTKIFALIIAPLLLGKRLSAWIIFFSTLLLLSWPYRADFLQMLSGLRSMSDLWLFNAPLFSLLLKVLPLPWVKTMLLAVFIGSWFIYAFYYTSKDTLANSIPRGDYLYGLMLLCGPVINPWYLVWVLAFSVIYPSRWAWTASVAVLLSYVIGLNLSASDLSSYQQPLWAISLEYSLIALAFVIDRIEIIRKPLTHHSYKNS